VVDLVLPLVVVVDDAVVDDAVVDSLEELVALPNGFPLLKRLNRSAAQRGPDSGSRQEAPRSRPILQKWMSAGFATDDVVGVVV